MDREAAIDQLLIKQEVRDVMMRYARGVNRLDGDLVSACFHPDATENHGTFRGSAQDFARDLPDNLRKGFQFTFHFLGNSLIEIRGNRASQETYFVGYHRLHPEADGSEKDILFGGRYLGIHESRNGGPWLIAERMVLHDWSRVEPVGEPWPSSATFEQGDHQGGNVDRVFHLFTRGTR